jgi:hypothetical protein
MKVTTVRFSEDLWETVSAEADRAGVSASQFIREAALARAAAAAGSRGDVPFAAFAATIHDAARLDLMSPERERELRSAIAAVSRALAANTRDDALAVQAQSEQTLRLTHELRARRPRRQPKRPT